MNLIRRNMLALVILATITNSVRAEEGFTPLFDGKSLDGWTIKCKPADKEDAQKFWTVDNGTILADSLGNTKHDYVWLVTNKEYADFELRLSFQAYRTSKGNSGIQIRSRYDEKAGYLDGPQIDINPPDPWRTGMMWDETRGNQWWLYPKTPKGKWVDKSMAPKEFKFVYSDDTPAWNDMRITVEGMKIKAWLNNIQITDYDGAGTLDDQIHQSKNVGQKGVIALQIHIHDELKIRYKDIRIKESK